MTEQPRRFHLNRHRDISGISGTGVVADGVRWPDGTASVRWRGPRPSTVHWDRVEDAEAVHGHGGATEIVWTDEERAGHEETSLRDQIAEALARHDGLRWGPGQSSLPSGVIERYHQRADAVMAVLPDQTAEIGQIRESHKASLAHADKVNNGLMAEVQRYAEGTERPVLWSVYNAMHRQALTAEAEVERLRAAQGSVLTTSERQFLTFALDQAADQMACRGDEFTAEDTTALAKFRRMVDEGSTS